MQLRAAAVPENLMAEPMLLSQQAQYLEYVYTIAESMVSVWI